MHLQDRDNPFYIYIYNNFGLLYCSQVYLYLLNVKMLITVCKKYHVFFYTFGCKSTLILLF